MKRYRVCISLLVLSLVLAACASSHATSTATATAAATDSAGDAASAQGTLSPVAMDILGIFKLEGTDLALDATQAATLLPLWQAYRSLLNSDTAAAAELEAVKTQIDEALTAEQQDAIAAMNLTLEDLVAMAEQFGVSQAVASTSTRASVVGASTGADAGGDAPPSGDGSMSVPPSDGASGMPTGDTGAVDPSMMVSSTPQASQSASSSQGDMFSQALLDPLIELLEQRAAS